MNNCKTQVLSHSWLYVKFFDYINFAAAYAGHIVAMKEGCIVAEGSPDKIITREVLNPVFDHDFHITEHDGKSVCLYFESK